MKPELTIYVKLTNGCQLKCDHCFNAGTNFSGDMDNQIVEDVISFIQDKSKNNLINFVLHGGEPLLNGLNKAAYIIDNVQTNKKYVTTNLMYDLTPSHIQFFKRFDLVSTSWDYKIRFKTQNQERLWRKNLLTLIEEGINTSVIITLSKYVVDELEPESIFKMCGVLGVKHFNFERLTETGNAKKNNLKANNADIDKWLLKAYELYEKSSFKIPLFEGVEESVKYGNLIGCRRRECQRSVITINTDGSICGCPNSYKYIYGDISGNFDKDKFNDLQAKEALRSNRCYMCELYKYCNGDCCQLSWDDTGCPGMPSVFKYVLNKKQS